MKAHIITIGDEILIGQVLNTNAAFIGDLLTKNQITISKNSVVSDDIKDIINEIKSALKYNDLVITTGGLGPTHDDVTRDAVVKIFNTDLIVNEDVLSDIKNRFAKINRQMSKVNEAQALVPQIANVIRNNYGTAPGFWIEKDKKIFIALPGVPFEMKQMMYKIIPSLKEKNSGLDSYTMMVNLLTIGIAESTLFQKFGNLNELLDNTKLAFLPSQYGVKLRITATEVNEETAKNKLTEIEQKIRSIVGRFIFGKDDEDLAEVVGRLLKERGLTISIAESCTGGNISNMITNYSGSSKFFERGIIAYSNAAKVELLKVDEDSIVKFGAVSLEVAKQMAEGVRAISGTDIGLSVTGIMGPTGATDEKPLGTVFIGLCDSNFCIAKKYNFGDDRVMNKQRTTQASLDLVRKYLLGIELDA